MSAHLRKQSRRARKKKPFVFDKYDLYMKAVQSPETDAEFLQKVYRDLRKAEPQVLREDFCGTFLLSKAWVELDAKKVAHGVDIDPEPLDYGRRQYLAKMPQDARARLHLHRQSVLDAGLPVADVSVAMNFSYFLFKTRADLKKYFSNVHSGLKKDGLLFCDLFGGSLCQEKNEEKTQLRNFTYYWDQESFDPVTHSASFAIHFRPKGREKMERVFTYDWRMWTIPEVRELLLEVGFKKTHVYWEGSNRKGEGSGVFSPTEVGEECQSWVSYVVAEK